MLYEVITRLARARVRQFTSPDRFRSIDRYQLRPLQAWLALLACALPA